MKKILLHCCCAPCAAYVIKKLQERYNVTLFYFNPNIFPEEEYKKRLNETKSYLKKIDIPLLEGEYDHNWWLKQVRGFENEPERGKRCKICYKLRLEETAKRAKRLGFNLFCSTLSISPHKDAELINKIGRDLLNKYNVQYLESDWKKHDGFKKSCDISKEQGFYRQEYCGCEFSLVQSKKYKVKSYETITI